MREQQKKKRVTKSSSIMNMKQNPNVDLHRTASTTSDANSFSCQSQVSGLTAKPAAYKTFKPDRKEIRNFHLSTKSSNKPKSATAAAGVSDADDCCWLDQECLDVSNLCAGGGNRQLQRLEEGSAMMVTKELDMQRKESTAGLFEVSSAKSFNSASSVSARSNSAQGVDGSPDPSVYISEKLKFQAIPMEHSGSNKSSASKSWASSKMSKIISKMPNKSASSDVLKESLAAKSFASDISAKPEPSIAAAAEDQSLADSSSAETTESIEGGFRDVDLPEDTESLNGGSFQGDDERDESETVESTACEAGGSKKSKKTSKKKACGVALLLGIVLIMGAVIGLGVGSESSVSSYLAEVFAPSPDPAPADTEPTPKTESDPCVEESVRALLLENISTQMKEKESPSMNQLRGNDESTSKLTRMHMVQQLTSDEIEGKDKKIRRRLNTPSKPSKTEPCSAKSKKSSASSKGSKAFPSPSSDRIDADWGIKR
mmetsp:Transcript_6834/g.15628  ORF Transcript_6834/g.15628 Transcript_6834/m.15628 type:complete len:486 (+) Transcript_6834:41-1498(+)